MDQRGEQLSDPHPRRGSASQTCLGPNGKYTHLHLFAKVAAGPQDPRPGWEQRLREGGLKTEGGGPSASHCARGHSHSSFQAATPGSCLARLRRLALWGPRRPRLSALVSQRQRQGAVGLDPDPHSLRGRGAQARPCCAPVPSEWRRPHPGKCPGARFSPPGQPPAASHSRPRSWLHPRQGPALTTCTGLRGRAQSSQKLLEATRGTCLQRWRRGSS